MFLTLHPPTRVVKDCYAKNMHGMCLCEYSFIEGRRYFKIRLPV